ncbi:MAG: hypothetical protein M5U34_02780 [Chloroflexi bacterium]|nr:hypothetical protein [Chloroflexota bacterium]
MGETAVLALTMYEDEQYFFEMLKAGASGYVPKRAAPMNWSTPSAPSAGETSSSTPPWPPAW